MLVSILVPILALILGLLYEPYVLAVVMLGVEVVFSLCLIQENKKTDVN
jgi:hypothetical protein